MEKLKSQNKNKSIKKLLKLEALPKINYLNQVEREYSDDTKLSIIRQKSQVRYLKEAHPTLSNIYSPRISPSSTLTKVGEGYYTPSSFSPGKYEALIPTLNIAQQKENDSKIMNFVQGSSSRTNQTKNNQFSCQLSNEKQTGFCKEAREAILTLNRAIQKLQIKGYKNSKTIQSLQTQNKYLRKKLWQQESVLKAFNEIFEPYKSNLDLIQTSLGSIKQKLQNNLILSSQLKGNQNECIQERLDLTCTKQPKIIKKGSNIYQVTQNHQQIIETYEGKMMKLNTQIERLTEQNIQLRQQNTISRNQNELLNQVLKQIERNSQLKQLFLMTSQELYEYRLKYQQARASEKMIEKANSKLQQKIKMLASLVGYGVISKIKSEELEQVIKFTQNIAKYPISVRITNDITGINHLQFGNKSNQIKDIIVKSVQKTSGFQSNQRIVYRPNFMVFFQYTYRQILGQVQQNYNSNVIKADLFVLMRAILDSYYINLKNHLSVRSQSVRFPDFVQNFMENFKIKQDVRRIIYYSNLNNLQFQEKELFKIGFLIKLMDSKICQLPEVVTTREFLLRETPRDQIFYYLMCRNLFHCGSQLLNQINCGDAFVLSRFQLIKPKLIILLQRYDRNIRDTVFNNINAKKIKKGHTYFIKPAYVCRLLLELYRKVKLKKQGRLKQIFQNVYFHNRLPLMKYIHFRQILSNNFGFLSGSDICRMYRDTCALFNSEKFQKNDQKVSFFDCFYACCSQEIFLKETQKWQKQIQSKLNGTQKSPQTMRNQMIQLIPQVIYQQGNEQLHTQYMNILQNSYSDMKSRLEIVCFLSKIMIGQTVGNFVSERNKKKGEQQMSGSIDQLIEKCIQWINGNFRSRQSNQMKMQNASKKLGKVFKQKVYQFYQELILDINKEVQKAKGMS